MDTLQEVLDLSVVFTKPPLNSSLEALASITLRCEALNLEHTGDLFTDPLTQAEQDDLFWYLEEYWKWPYLEFAERGKRVEALLGEVGRRLYDALFQGKEAQTIVQAWQQRENVRHQISIVSEIARILRLPWELLSNLQGFFVLHTDCPISMVRRISIREQATLTPPIQLPLRILLVTARPEGEGFVDSRSISRRLVDELQKQSEAENIELEFLRPPTFAALRDRLKSADCPIHVLHFDGHGGLGGKKQQGVLLFETNVGKQSPVKASDLAKVLSTSGVRLAVLTACQSAMNTEDTAFSSVATQLISNGVDAVIAMSSSILVASAALYVEVFYHALAEGLPVSIAQEQARQALQRDPHRHLFRRHQDEEAAQVTLSDWWVPHFYQQRPLTLHAATAPRKPTPQPTSTPARFNDAMPPEPRYRFSGRARELLQIERALLRQRLVVLSGFGGVGKTALVREAADWLTRTGLYTSACFVSFEHGGDATTLLSELGTFLGVNDSHYDPGAPDAALARLQPALAARPTLVIADNLESLLPTGEAPLELTDLRQLWQIFRDLVTLSAGVLLTTRDSTLGDDLLAPGTHVAALSLGRLLPDDAYALATSLLEDLGISRQCAPYADLRDLLQQLDHHPLAIQLVLPTLQEHSLAQIRSDFAKLLLSFTDDTVTGRNRSLLASLDYSLRRLTKEQRALLPSLAIFEGGLMEADLLTITQISETDWTPLRQALVRAALLTPEPVTHISAPFLRFHPVLTPFLRSQPGALDQDLLVKAAAHYAELADYLHRQDQQHPQEVRTLILKELPNLRQSLTILLKQGDLEAATVLTDRIVYFLGIFGRWHERDNLRGHLADALTARPPADTDTLTFAAYLQESGLGEDERQSGNLRAATSRFTQLLARIESHPTDTPLGRGSYEHASTLSRLAHCLRDTKQLKVAEGYLRQALKITDAQLQQQPEDTDSLLQRSTTLTHLADVLMDQSQYQPAREAYEAALVLYIQISDQKGQAVIEGQLGALALAQHDNARAWTHNLAALNVFQTLGEPAMEAIAWHQLGLVAQEQQQWSEAERCYRTSLAIRERLGDTGLAATTCNQLAVIAQLSGRPNEAEGWYRRALNFDEQAQPGSPNPGILHNLAALLLQEIEAGRTAPTRLADAKQLAEQALVLMETRESSEIWIILNVLSRIAELDGQKAEALRYRRRERETYAAFTGNRYYIDQQHRRLIVAIAVAAQGNDAAQQAIEVALPMLEEHGWKIAAATRRLWAGERDWHTLAEDLSPTLSLLILRVLETIALSEEAALAQPALEAIMTSLPTPILDALQQKDQAAFAQALAALAPEEQLQVLAVLQELQRQAKDGKLEQVRNLRLEAL